MRIDIAYCNELKRNVDIYEACLEFSIQSQHRKFTFKCSDPECNAAAPGQLVRVTGVNHQYLPEDDNVNKSPHFRAWDAHAPFCMWRSFEAVIKEVAAELPVASTFAQLARKNRKLISKFILPDGEDMPSDQHDELTELIKERDPQKRRSNLKKYVSTVGATTRSLESLISCYEELKTIDKLSEELLIPGVGKTTYKQFFRSAKNFKVGSNCIWSGGAKLSKRYGSGFSLTFYDTFNQLPIKLYISTQQLRSARYGMHLTRIVDAVEKNPERPYFKVYWFGRLEHVQHDDKECYQVQAASLAHIVLRVVVPKPKVASDNE